MSDEAYALNIVDEAVHLALTAPGSLTKRLAKAYGILHPIIPLKLAPRVADHISEFTSYYVLALDRGSGHLEAGFAQFHHSKRVAAADALLHLQRALILGVGIRL